VATANPASCSARAIAAPARGSVTPRELQVLGLIADGRPAKSIADRLGIAVSTVRNHIRAILVELGCQQLEAAAQARRRGLIR
jgi:DNA-binding NarL/FixJ family response regulator